MTKKWWTILQQKWPRSPFWKLLVLLPGVIVLLIAATMDKTSTTAVWLTATFGILALILPAWMAIYVPLQDKRKSLLQGRDEVLEPLRLEPTITALSLRWLLPRWSRSSVHGRRNTDQKLDAWLNTSAPVMIIEGGPLVGKTRMAIEWADSLSPTWESGWLRPDKAHEAVQRITAYGKNTIIVADGLPSHLAQLILDLTQHNSVPKIRLLLTVRSTKTIRLDDPYAAAVIQEVKPLRLGPIPEVGDRERWFKDLCTHYADRLGVAVPAQGLELVRELGSVPIGVLHAAALATVRKGGGLSSNSDIQGVLYELWKTEVSTWRTAPGVPDTGRDGPSDVKLERLELAISSLSLLDPKDADAAIKLLGKVPSLAQLGTESLKDIAGWAASMYPPIDSVPGTFAEFTPRIIALAGFLDLANHDNSFANALLGFLTDAEAGIVLDRLVEASPLLPGAAAWITVVIDRDFERLTAALDKALAVTPVNQALENELVTCTREFLLEEGQTILLQERIPEGSARLLQVELANLRVEQARAGVGQAQARMGGAQEHQHCLAQALNSLSDRLAQVGRVNDARKTAAECANIYRRLAEDDSARFEPELAAALDTLATASAACGGRETEAMLAAEESLAIYRKLTSSNPAQYEVALAQSLNTMGNRLAETGSRTLDALNTAQESLSICRRLATTDRDRYEPTVAWALNNMVSRLRDSGHATEALNAARESVGIYRRLIATNRALHEPGLALALHNLGGALALKEGGTDETLSITQECVTIYRGLAEMYPALYEPDLAGALSNLSGQLMHVGGRGIESLKVAEEAIDILRRLNADNPTLHEPRLAQALNNMVGLLGKAGGRRQSLLEASEESVATYRRLVTDNPSLHGPGLARALGNLANVMGQVTGRAAESLEATRECASMFRKLARAQPAVYDPDFAQSVENLANRLTDAGRDVEATVYWEESLNIYEQLSLRDSRFDVPKARVQKIVWERTRLS